ncbi:hypothetical protein Q2T83_06425 [Fervidibacter sacchari]|uniref:Uncharacterized protein n=1 Tax=Candidatus Fervidibacter sacchari TaxID=1448929 RepID=A0ABT2ELH8_9BACT|nr:hypothetical protein [Candidatus Fervidibacter sacchari]MCS3918803.1 hypothetical protein [Candidatus Fervidibacter sacchari]WKU17451.1 hypothetical protein Q2T83_06425 [Candidatus Fervidibacter sacchari]
MTNREMGKSAGQEGKGQRVANSDWRTVLSGWQCPHIVKSLALKTTHRTHHPALKFFGSPRGLPSQTGDWQMVGRQRNDGGSVKAFLNGF